MQPVTPEPSAWLIVLASTISAMIQALKKAGLLDRVPKRWIPVVSVAMTAIAATATSIASGASALDGLTQGILIGLSATGLYEVGKIRPEAEAPPETQPPEAQPPEAQPPAA